MKKLISAILTLLLLFNTFGGFNETLAKEKISAGDKFQTDLNKYDFNKAKEEIRKHDVISFDIFDTLLVRPYAEPEGLHKHLKELKKHGINKDEAWLQEAVIQPHAENIELFNYAKSLGKKVIIISDMYLHSDFLEKVLKKNNVYGWDKLYVSSDLNMKKHSGKLFDYVLKDLKIKPKSMLHLGDNLHSDGKMAESREIDCFYTPKLIDRLFEKVPRLKKYYDLHKNDLTTSIFLGAASLNVFKYSDDYWYNFGYLYGGPIVYTYTKWLLEQFEKDKIKDAVFVARDGYNLQKIFELIKGGADIKSHYFYGSRKIGKKYTDCAGQDRTNFQKYVDSLKIRSKNVACVDACTSAYTSLKLLKSYLPDPINVKGYYYKSHPDPKYNQRTFSAGAGKRILCWPLIELYMSAPTLPIIDVNNGQPVYSESNKKELSLTYAKKQMYKGMYDFAKDAEKSFSGIPLCADDASTDKFSNIFYKEITAQDKVYMDKIFYQKNSGIYKSIFKCYE